MEETKIIYHIDDEDTPYLIKLSVPADRVTLGDFKNALHRPNYKFFFKSMDDDFGVVKEEIIDDEAHLPCFNGRVVSWLVAADNSTSDTQSQGGADSQTGDVPPERVGGIGDSRPPSFHANASSRDKDSDICDTCTETESVMSTRRENRYASARGHHDGHRMAHQNMPPRVNGHGVKGDKQRAPHGGFDATSSMLSSDIDTTSFMDSEEDASSRLSTATERSSKYGRQRRRKRRHRMPPISRASSFSSITDSTMSLNIITVTLNMDTVNFLGISIVGQSNKGGDGGIYVGSIMKGGAVAQDGRVEPGDMILEVNGVSFENMSNDDAVKTLREAVQKPGPITLVVAKCWDPNPKGYFTVPRQEPVRPIDPSAWVAHTEAVRGGGGPGGAGGNYGRRGPGGAMNSSLSTMTSASSSLSSTLPESERFDDLNLTVNTDMATIVRVMAQPDSGLEIRDRMWLKITIPNAFIGSDLVDWLHKHVDGFADRRDGRKYACNLLKAGYIRHTVNKLTFSEQCYYVFGDLGGAAEFDYSSDILSGRSTQLLPNTMNNLSSLTLEDIDSMSEIDRDTLGPLPPPPWPGAGPGPQLYTSNPYGPASYLPPPVPPGGSIPAVPVRFPGPPASYSSSSSMNYAPPPNYASVVTGPSVGNNAALPYGFVHDSTSYVSMPGANGSVHSSAKYDKTCACIVSHTYKQFRKLWENPDKNAVANATAMTNGVYKKSAAKFADDMDRSTSSSSGSSTSGNSVRNAAADNTPATINNTTSADPHKSPPTLSPQSGSDTESASMTGGGGKRVGGGGELPVPPPRNLATADAELNASKQSFRIAMGNLYTEDTLHAMGEL